MMPDLAPYQTEVVSAYVITLLLLALLAAFTLLEARRTKRQFDELEGRGDAEKD